MSLGWPLGRRKENWGFKGRQEGKVRRELGDRKSEVRTHDGGWNSHGLEPLLVVASRFRAVIRDKDDLLALVHVKPRLPSSDAGLWRRNTYLYSEAFPASLRSLRRDGLRTIVRLSFSSP